MRHKTTLRMHSVAFTFDDCTREMPMFTYRHANMNTKSSVKRYAQHQPHNMPTIATKPTHTSLFRGIAIRTTNAATCRQSLAATASAGCSSKRRSTGALREPAQASDSSQLLLRSRQAAGATTHRPFWSMSRRVSDAPHMRSPHSWRRRGPGTPPPLKWRKRQYPPSH